jgi:hypothetical protein
VDNRQSYEYTEVTLDYNAGFTGAIAALVDKHGGLPFTDETLDLGWNHPNAEKKPTTNKGTSSFPPTVGVPQTSAANEEIFFFEFFLFALVYLCSRTD